MFDTLPRIFIVVILWWVIGAPGCKVIDPPEQPKQNTEQK